MRMRRSIGITLHEADGILNLRIEDDGRGIGIARKGRGLTGMQERVHGLGGRCVVEDAPDGGTRVSIGLPTGKPARSAA